MVKDLSGAAGWDHTTYHLFSYEALHDAGKAGSYRLIGLESCILKMMTLLVERRTQQWMSDIDIIPETQNGFRKGYNALNNPWILQSYKRVSVDKPWHDVVNAV
ncbi:hypothetical protein BDZ89DRAFT_274573 [Hymenopellis radicata]|nr:hypothetical protein BDZ89DRAFT_274573 [Hymenopellis radicata]